MFIIVENNKITGIEKNLLNDLNITLESISEFINTLELQIASLTDSQLNINNKTFNVNEIEIISTKNIKIFKLKEVSNSKLEVKEEPSLNPDDLLTTPKEDDNLIKEEPSLNPDDLLTTPKEDDNLIKEEPSLNPDDLLTTPKEDDNLIKEEPSLNPDDLLATPKEDDNLIKEEPSLNPDDLLTTPKEDDNLIKEEPSLNPDDLLTTPKEDISTEKNSEKEKENIEEEPTTDSLDFSNQEPLKEPLKQNEINLGEESEEIEISFEDDLDEIKEILELSTAEFNKLIEEELQKASNELGIDIKDLRDWYLQLLEQIQEEKSTIYKNIKKADYDALHKNYHKLKGAALNLRLSKIAIILKKLDELSKDKEDINKIKKITDDFYLLFENKTKTSSQEKDEITPIKNNFLEKIIIQTIQTYLKTQDEERFKKDKKYIEKVLGQKIESIEDLQKFVKGI
ncbi:MAG: hypothetical protein ABGX26_04200 [Nautiliaceae bacterium]